MVRLVWIFCCLFIAAPLFAAQLNDLVPQDITVVQRQDAFGQTVQVAQGRLVNQGSHAYTNISLSAEVYDADNQQIGEGLGFLVNACGAALAPEFALQPGESQTFDVTLELFDTDAPPIQRVVIFPDATVTTADASTPPALAPGITPVTREEVVDVEWIDGQTLRYGVGCADDVFTALKWYQHDRTQQATTPIEHPKAALVTDALKTQTGLTDPALFNRSYLTFDPDGRRLVYQNDHNDLITAESDGSFKRVLYNTLYKHSLHGITWLDNGNFLAYYFGAYGEPVLYFTATADGQPISAPLSVTVPSETVPGASPDGQQVVISGTFNDQTGYYLKSLVADANDLLFEADLPGNNYPAPIYAATDDDGAIIYMVRPVNGQAEFTCFDLAAHKSYDLTPLPLALKDDERGWMWLSPDQHTLALAANGMESGLWLVDLTQLPACQSG